MSSAFLRKSLLISLLIILPFPFSNYAVNDKPMLIIEKPVDAGFFALLIAVIGGIDLYDQKLYSGIKIDFNAGLYLDPKVGPNWWDYFFEPINFENDNAEKVYISEAEAYSSLTVYGARVPRERCGMLIKKYCHLRPHIEQEIQAIVENKFKKYFILGVHHRGTDKKLEAPIVQFEKTRATVDWILNNAPPEIKNILRIFVATDDQKFLDYMKIIYPSLILYNEFKRSTNDEPIHYNKDPFFYSSNYQRGKEVLFDCYLLSRTHFLIHPGTSCVSLFATKINPLLPSMITSQ